MRRSESKDHEDRCGGGIVGGSGWETIGIID